MKTLLLALVFFSSINATAQLPPMQWVNELVGARSISLATDAAGNVYTFGNIGPGATLDVDPGPGIYMLNGNDGTKIIYKFSTDGVFVWAKQLPENVTTEFIRVDATGNVHVVGQFSLTADFDPGPGVFNLTTVNQNDAFILKLDAAGSFLWAKSHGGPASDIAYSVAISAAGTVYTTGYFSGTVDFDPGAGVFNMTSGFQGCFISALDAGGNFLWAKRIEGNNNLGNYITTNSLGNLVIVGEFAGTVDLDPGPGVLNLTSAGGSDIFILKLDGLGNFIWAKAVGGIASEIEEAVSLDPLGNVYVCGRFLLTADFDPGAGIANLTAFGSTDIFVLKLNDNGNFLWARQMGGVSPDGGKDIATDAAGNVYTTGIFQDVADFDPGPGVFNLTTKGNNDIFISKLDTDGNFVWAVGFGSGTSEDQGQGISVDATGSVYTTGSFDGQVDFDPGPGVAILIHNNASIFLHKFGPGGVLPLSLIDFTGTPTANGTLLKWQTTSEINTKSFEIEWSDDGQHFKKIAIQKAAGNSNIELRYNYLHTERQNGYNYYRLKMMDLDGQFTYSKVIRISTSPNSLLVNTFPNPVNDLLKLNIQSPKTETILFNLRSADGRLVLSRSFNLVKGSNGFNWNLQTVPPGKYFISSGSNNFKTIQVIKQ